VISSVVEYDEQCVEPGRGTTAMIYYFLCVCVCWRTHWRHRRKQRKWRQQRRQPRRRHWSAGSVHVEDGTRRHAMTVERPSSSVQRPVNRKPGRQCTLKWTRASELRGRENTRFCCCVSRCRDWLQFNRFPAFRL